MYSLKSYTEGIDARPAKIIYSLPSYHNRQELTAPQLNGGVDFEEAKDLVDLDALQKTPNAKEKFLEKCEVRRPSLDPGFGERKTDQGNSSSRLAIERLQKLSKRLDRFIQNFSSTTPSKNAQEKAPKKDLVDKKATFSNETNAQKTQKNETPNRKSAKENKKSQPPPTPRAIVEEEAKKKFPPNSPEIVHASLTASTRIFPVHDYGKPEVFPTQKEFYGTYRSCDLGWLNLFKSIQQKRSPEVVLNIAIDGGSGMKDVTNSSVIISFKKGQSLELSCEPKAGEQNTCLIDPLSVWKFLGSLFGLYSQYDIIPVDQWLELASSTLENPNRNQQQLVRQLSRHLAKTDFLSSGKAVCLSDVIMRSLFNKSPDKWTVWNGVEVPNNVQLWVKRVDESLASFGYL